MNRRGFLGLLGGGLLAASTKAYSFLGNILRPSGDSIVWTDSGGIVKLAQWAVVYAENGPLTIEKTLREGEFFEASGQSWKCRVVSYQKFDDQIFRHDDMKDIWVHDGCTLTVKFKPPKVTFV